MAIIIAGPIIAERFGFPGLIGLIFLGMFAGPFVLGWIPIEGLVSDLGDIGLLYLMFLAGLSFNIRAFMENRSNAIVYGLLGFFIPFERSPIPTAAVRVLRPWNRIVVFTGTVGEDWSAEDTWLALEIGTRLRNDRDATMLVFTPEPEAVVAKVEEHPNLEVVAEPSNLRDILGRINDDDLIIAPARIVSGAGAYTQWRVSKALRNVSVMVVAGPHRLSVDGTSVQRNLHGVVDSTDPTSVPARD
ncbi:MAG: cation:proton antiporter [Actinomycetia bacterium]|nr:cation:proton antiporter [Actinomycetes bacterium]